MKKNLGMLIAVIHVLPLTVLGADSGWSAKVVPLPRQLDGYGLPEHLIEVEFPEGGFPIEEVRKPFHYSLSSATQSQTKLPIKAAKPKGGTGGDGEEATHAEGVLLVPLETINPSSRYVIEANFDGSNSGPIQVAPAGGTPEEPSESELQRIIDLFTKTAAQNLLAKIDGLGAFTGEKVPTLGYNVDFSVGGNWKVPTNSSSWHSGSFQKLSLSSEGLLELEDSPDVTDYLQLSGSYQKMWLWLLDNPLTDRGDLMYFLGFRLKGFEFESDQDLDVINYTAKPQIAAWVPYSNIPALWWSEQIQISGNAATPAFIFFGYSLVEPIETEIAEVSEEKQRSDRLEGELAYAFPLTSSIRLGFRGRLYWLFDSDQTANYKEAFAQYYLDEGKNASLIFKYVNGAVPPTFEKGDAASAGFSFNF